MKLLLEKLHSKSPRLVEGKYYASFMNFLFVKNVSLHKFMTLKFLGFAKTRKIKVQIGISAWFGDGSEFKNPDS